MKLLLTPLVLLLSMSGIRAGQRGCQCFVKSSDNGPALASLSTSVGGLFAGCNRKSRDQCKGSCRRWADGLTSEGSLTSMCEKHGNEVAPNSCNGDGLKLIVYSKLDCDGAQPFSKWGKEYLACDKTLCCCKTRVESCHGRVKINYEGYFCKSTLSNSLKSVGSYHSSKQNGLVSRTNSFCTKSATTTTRSVRPEWDPIDCIRDDRDRRRYKRRAPIGICK